MAVRDRMQRTATVALASAALASAAVLALLTPGTLTLAPNGGDGGASARPVGPPGHPTAAVAPASAATPPEPHGAATSAPSVAALAPVPTSDVVGRPAPGGRPTFMDRAEHLATSPGGHSGLDVGSGRIVTMRCWTTGPDADGGAKWFEVPVDGSRDGGFVPANSVDRQTVVGHC